MRRLLPILLSIFCYLAQPAHADVVKPALIEINAHTTGKVVVDMRVSLEALLTGIDARYQNTQDAPTAEQYDHYRAMRADELQQVFTTFHDNLIGAIELEVDNQAVLLTIETIDIPEPGYTGIPRISSIRLNGEIARDSRTVRWYYPAAFGDNVVRVRQVDEAGERWHWSQWQWIRDDASSDQFPLDELFRQRPLSETIFSYIIVGFEHILPAGLDHILFIIGLFLLSTHIRPLLWQVTMFTLAHTLTLALATSGVIELPASIVEPLIALSIAWIGIENIRQRKLQRSRLLLVFLFGLLHGLGFAGVLRDFGMPEEAFITALISFNVGVELGQLAIICLAFICVFAVMHKQELYRRFVVIPLSAMITMTGLFWTIERVAF